MSPNPPSGSLPSGAGSAVSPDNFRVIRKRNRVPLSCAPCRHRKLRCNRQSPCDNCTKRGDAPSCTYAAPVPRKKGSQSSAGANATPDDMQNRIDRLESLVLSLMTNGASSAGPSAANRALSSTNTTDVGSGSLGPNLDADPDDGQDLDGDDHDDESEIEGVTKSFGILKVDPEKQKTVYIGEAHWASLLHEISEVKNYFLLHKKEYEAHMEKVNKTRHAVGSNVGAGPALLFSASEPPSRAVILAQIPPRYITDAVINRYFNTFDPALHVLHPPTFYRQYDAHWQDPSKTSFVWLAMLFAMMRLAMVSYVREGDEPPEFQGRCQDMAANYRTQMAHCMITADYTKPHNHIIETLIFHLHGEYTSNRDAEASVWVLVGIIARLAMRMGYHRDAKLFPSLTPFQGEMRRRIWTVVRTADLLFSFQAALPPMIRIGDSDTDLPSNLFDHDFDENSPVLPPPRPNNEATPISYMISKGRLAYGFGRVLEAINGVNRKGYDEVLKIDRGLREIYDSMPDFLKLKSTKDTATAPVSAPVSLTMARFSLAILYHKSQCVLHGPYMRQARGNNRYAYSRRTSLDSAMHLLQYQALQHRATLERDRPRNISKHATSLATHDFSLAATVLCMDLYNHHERPDHDVSTPNTSVSGGSVSGSSSLQSDTGAYVPGLPYSREEMLSALEQSRDVYHDSRELSTEAYKASTLLNLLLEHLRSSPSPTPAREPKQSQQPPQCQPPPHDGVRSHNHSLSPNPLNPTTAISQDEQSAASMLEMLQSSGGIGQSPGQPAASYVQPTQPNGQWDSQDKVGDILGPPDDLLQFTMFGNTATVGGLPNQFSSSLFSGIADGGAANVNLDWEMWDQYMQGPNVPLDPAVNLWGDDGPSPNSISNNSDTNNNNLFTNSASSPRSSTSYFGQQPGQKNKNASNNPNSQIQQMPTLSANAPAIGTDRRDSNAGQVFMGVQSPQSGGLPIWK